MGKQLKFTPFGDSTSPYAFDEEFKCAPRFEKTLDEMDLAELHKELSEHEEALCDWDTIIDIELEDVRRGDESQLESLRSDRQQRQQCLVEYRAIKKQIKMMMKTDEGEKIAA